MTLITPQGGEDSAQEILSLAERHFHRMLERIEEIISEVRCSDTQASKEAQIVVRDLGKAMQTVFDERAKVEKLRKHTAGVVHDIALDFDAARDEIGRRMARLRAAQGSGDISERPD